MLRYWRPPCRSVGIGRRWRLKIAWAHARGGSSPSSGTRVFHPGSISKAKQITLELSIEAFTVSPHIGHNGFFPAHERAKHLSRPGHKLNLPVTMTPVGRLVYPFGAVPEDPDRRVSIASSRDDTRGAWPSRPKMRMIFVIVGEAPTTTNWQLWCCDALCASART